MDLAKVGVHTMRTSQRILLLGTGGALVIAAGVHLGARQLFAIEGGASSPTPIQLAQLRPSTGAPNQAAPAPAPPPSAPAGPQRVETTAYDSWAVTCEDTVAGGAVKRACLASLRVMNQNQAVLLNWQIGFNDEGRFVTAVHVPSGLAIRQGDQTIGGPIMIANGVELKFGNGQVRRLSYVTCGPQQCLAEAPIDDGFMREAVANANAKATITIHTGGGPIPFDLAIKGIDKAISVASARK
jgi:invasion protein IalB